MVIAPPRVVGNWEKGSLNSLKAIPNTQVVSRKAIKSEDEQDSSRQIEHAGVIIIDESHTVTPGFEESSKKAEAIEYAPPSWNVCLSATLLGNKDVDWLTHLKEKRASIFMSPEYIEAMRKLFKREGVNTELFRDQDRNDALSEEARQDLADMLAPFLAHRQRSCLGESKNRTIGEEASYPPFKLHGRPKRLELSNRQEAVINEIVRLQAKQEVRESFASGGAPESYIAVDQIVRHLNSDLLEVENIRKTMMEAVEAARRISPPRPGAVADRISVAFVSI